MLVLEFQVRTKEHQYQTINKVIHTAQFIQHKCLCFWMDNSHINQDDLNQYCRVLAQEFEWANQPNSQTSHSSAERAWSANRRKARQRLAQAYFKISSPRKELAKRLAYAVIRSHRGCQLDDKNVARNILKLGFSTVGHTGTRLLDSRNAWGEETSTFSEVILFKRVISQNQESPVTASA